MTTRQRRASVARSGGEGLSRRWRRSDGQATSEYLVLSGVVAVTVIGAMALFVAPVARTFVALFRRLALFMTSTSSW